MDAGRYKDAAALWERALHVKSGTEEERLWAKEELGTCLRFAGQYSKALAQYGEIWVAVRDRNDLQETAYRALYLQVNTHLRIGDAKPSDDQERYSGTLQLIEEGLSWLRDVGQENWRAALLLEQAIVLWRTSKREEALDAAEEAYRLEKRFRGLGWRLSDYVHQVAKFARILGQHERALRILDEIEGKADCVLSQVRLSDERARVLLAMDPPEVLKGLEAARRTAHLAEEMQQPQDRLDAYATLAVCTIAADSHAEAQDALEVVRGMALENDTMDRLLMLRRACESLIESRDRLAVKENSAARKLDAILTDWLKELQQALDSCGNEASFATGD